MVNSKYFSINEDEERVLDYRPEIKYNQKEINTIDNIKKKPTNQSINYKEISSLSKRYIDSNISGLIAMIFDYEKILKDLLDEMSNVLVKSKFSINVNIELPVFYKDIIKNGVISFEAYKKIPNTEEYQLIHDIWFEEASSLRGNIVAEAYPIISDISYDIIRAKSIINDLLFYQSDLSIESQESDIENYILTRATNYENNFGLILEGQRENNMDVVKKTKKTQRILENEIKIETEITNILGDSIRMIRKPLGIISREVYEDIDGETATRAQKELDSFSEKIEISSKDIKIPLMYGYKTVANNVVKDRISSTNQYSHSVKDDVVSEILQLGRSWKNVCIPDIANYLSIGYNDSNLLYYITSGISDINMRLIESIKNYHKISLGDMNTRTKIGKEIVYKNMVRHIYNNNSMGGIQ